jgi:hypothetical protein
MSFIRYGPLLGLCLLLCPLSFVLTVPLFTVFIRCLCEFGILPLSTSHIAIYYVLIMAPPLALGSLRVLLLDQIMTLEPLVSWSKILMVEDVGLLSLIIMLHEGRCEVY